ncbi:MAG: IS30 family transposase [Clostridia bacterium]|nr:IS30 family transposase [Clostridia bacterium]
MKSNLKSHFTYSDRVKLQYNLDNNFNLSAASLARVLNKSRSAIYYEINTNVTILNPRDKFNNSKYICPRRIKFPFTCNGCVNSRCSHKDRIYIADNAHFKARKVLVNSRSDTANSRRTIKLINSTVSPLVLKGQSIYVAKLATGCPLSESTIRRYVDKGNVDIKRHNLPKAIRFKTKKEYNYPKATRLDINVINGRTYEDYLDYVSSRPVSKVIQVDSIIGKRNDSKAILTVYFVNSKLQLGFLYDRKHPNVPYILKRLYKVGIYRGYEIFDVVLADNGSEFKNLYKLEVDEETGEFYCKTFYCDPYKSCQKAECERNHGLFRRFIPKGNSFNTLTQERLDEIFSYINSYPRHSLNGKTPYELFSTEYNPIILSDLNIHKIAIKDVRIK